MKKSKNIRKPKDKPIFSERLVEKRKQAGYTQEKFATAFDNRYREPGKSFFDTLQNYEIGRSLPYKKDLFNICELLGNCDPGYLLGIYDESTKGLHEVSEATGLSERSITELQRNPRAVTLVNALLESSQINDLSRFYATLKVALDLQKEHYENIEQELIQVFSVPMIDEDKEWYREKIEEQDMDSVRFSEYLCRDAFSKFTAEIISGNS